MKGFSNKVRAIWEFTVPIATSSFLVTFWSNCLASWWLGGASHHGSFLLLVIGVSCLVIGGVFFQLAYRDEIDLLQSYGKKLNSNVLENKQWWLVSLTWWVLGFAGILVIGSSRMALALVVTICMIAYSATSRAFYLAPILLGTTRFAVYLLGASTGEWGITGLSVWNAIALGCYSTSIGLLRTNLHEKKELELLPFGLMTAPIFLSLAINGLRMATIALCGVFVLWVAASLRSALRRQHRNATYTISGLTAGVIIVDLMAINLDSLWISSLLLILFLVAILNSRKQPLAGAL